MRRRLLAAVVVAMVLVGVPVAVEHRPVRVAEVAPEQLLAQLRASASVAWSGEVATRGSLALPEQSAFATLGQLLGSSTRLRVWWRGERRWRVDRLRSTGETGLFRDGGLLVRWVSEQQQATITPIDGIRLPDAADLLPGPLARSLLADARPDELSSLPGRRVAGRPAAGLRLVPDTPGSTVAAVDVWADVASGVPLEVAVTAVGGTRPAVVSRVTELTLAEPDPADVIFRPAARVGLDYAQAADVAAAAADDNYLPLPATLGGLAIRDGGAPGRVAVFGRGATTVLVLPLRGDVSRPLRGQLADNGAQDLAEGTYASAGPVGLLLTRRLGDRPPVLFTGTVDQATLQAMADDLVEAR